MHIHCNQDLLVHNISIVSKAVSSKTTLPILEYIILINDQHGFRMKGFDLQLGIESSNIECTSIKTGVIALKAKIFFDIIRKLPKGKIEIIVDDNNKTTIKSNRSKFEITGMEIDDFPELPVVTKENTFSIVSNTLKLMIKKTLFSVALTENRPSLTGECFDVEDNVLSIVGVDGYRIAHIFEKINGQNNFTAIIPGRTLDEVSKIISPDEKETVTLSFSARHVLFETKECKIISNLIEGEFIKYKQMFTKDYKTKITVNRTKLLEALDRTMLISTSSISDNKRSPVKLDIKDKQVVITSNAEDGNCYEEVPLNLEGDVLEIAFNPKYIIDAVKTIEEDNVNLFFTSSLSPCIIKGETLLNQKYLILPLRVKY